MSDLTREEMRAVEMRSADAQRLLNDPTLWDVLRLVRSQAVHATVYGPDARDRDQSRAVVVAIDMVATELQSRIDTALNVADAQQRARAYE